MFWCLGNKKRREQAERNAAAAAAAAAAAEVDPEAVKEELAATAKAESLQKRIEAGSASRMEAVAEFYDVFNIDYNSLDGAKSSSSLISFSDLSVGLIESLEAERRGFNSQQRAQMKLFAHQSKMRPYVYDALLRKYALSHHVDMFAHAAEEGNLPKFFLDITPKDMAVGLILGSMPDELGQIISLLCETNSCIPLCFPIAASDAKMLDQNVSQSSKQRIGRTGRVFQSTYVNWSNMLYMENKVSQSAGTRANDKNYVNQKNGQAVNVRNDTQPPRLIVWHGSACGKSSLLQQAEVTNASLISTNPTHGGFVVPVDDLTKASLVHTGSIDLSAASSLIPGCPNVWVADVHVHLDAGSIKLDLPRDANLEEAKASVPPLDPIAIAKQTDQQRAAAENKRNQKIQRRFEAAKQRRVNERRTLIETANRGGISCGTFNKTLDVLLQSGLLCLHVDAQDFDPTTGECIAPAIAPIISKAQVVIWRDYDADADRGSVQLVSEKYGIGMAGGNADRPVMLLVENVASFRSQARANSVIKAFRQELASVLQAKVKSWKPMGSYLEMETAFENGKSSFEHQVMMEMVKMSGQAKVSFGLQAIVSEQKSMEEKERAMPWQNSNEMDEKVALALELADKVEELAKQREEYFHRGLDKLSAFFLQTILTLQTKDRQNLLQGFPDNRALQLSVTCETQLERIKIFGKRLLDMYSADQFVGMESFWNEIQVFYQMAVEQELHTIQNKNDPGVQQWYKLNQARIAYTNVIARRGAPMQILAGNPLHMCSQDFIMNVLKDLDVQDLVQAPGGKKDPKKKKLRVISVIGAQSSAKSTLMNFLFGAEFAVSAGRCTHGLYASVFFTEKYAILVLDSEGLLGVSDASRGDIFDGQMTLMCLICSHVVLINHKGELSRQLQDLIEICLFAMRHLKINKNKPKIGFVLRDQQDRSVHVHTQMLATMKSHLHESASKLGIALDDLIQLDDTSVYLLPSAYVTVRKHNTEVRWTPELFSQEVLALRASIFNIFDSPAMEDCWESLQQWYAHCCHVWDTLVRFGANLLHYKTIGEIEARKDLYELAKVTTRAIMEEESEGFRTQCQSTTTMFILRLQTSGTDSEFVNTEMIDMEFNRALTSLRDDFVQKSLVLFNQKANQDPRFHETMKEEARKKLGTPMDWVFENYLYTWKLALKKKADEHAMHRMWQHFTSVLNQYLSDSSHQAALSEEKARALFQTEWESYEEAFKDRLSKLAKSKEAIQYELIIQFNNVVSKLVHEGGPFSLLQELGPQYLWRRQTLLNDTDAEWEKKFFHDSWRTRVQKILDGNISKGDKTEYNLKNLKAALDQPNLLKDQIVPKLRAIIKRVLWDNIVNADEMDPFAEATDELGKSNEVLKKLDNYTMMDESMTIDWFRQLMDIIVRVIEKEHLSAFLINLKRPQMIHELSVLIRVAAYEKRLKEEEIQNGKEMDVLLEQKQQIEDHFLLIIKANSNDVEVAKNYATMYHQNIKGYISQEILNLCAEIRETVLQDMPDPAKAYERAYQQSFGARNYQEVLEYVLDVNAYVEKLFLIMFARRKAYVVDTKVASLRERVRTVYKLVLSICDQWASSLKKNKIGPNNSIGMGGTPLAKGMSSTDMSVQKKISNGSGSEEEQVKVTLKNLREFIAETVSAQQPSDEDLEKEANNPDNVSTLPGEQKNWKQDQLAKAYRVCADRTPETADFPVRDPQIFCSAFRQQLLQLQENLEERVEKRRASVVNLEELNISIPDDGAAPVSSSPKKVEDHDKSSTNSWIDDQLQKGLQEQSTKAWGLIKGCSARCPLCGSKCDQVGEHARHRCAHHLFPAFHGWMDRQNGFPSFHYCKSKEAFEGTYQCNDGEWRPLEVFLRETHEAWLPFCSDEDVSSVKDISLLQSAWCNCKVPLLEYFKPMVDEMPAEWEAFHEKDRCLVLGDLRKAKDVIRKVRERRFIPEDYYKNLKA